MHNNAYFLSHDYHFYINSLGFLFIFCLSLTKDQRSKRQTLLSVSAVHQPFYISTFLYLYVQFIIWHFLLQKSIQLKLTSHTGISAYFNFVEMPTVATRIPLPFLALQDNKIHCLEMIHLTVINRLFSVRLEDFKYKSKYETVGVLPIRIVKSNVQSVGPSSETNRK